MLAKVLGLITAGIFVGAAITEVIRIEKRKKTEDESSEPGNDMDPFDDGEGIGQVTRLVPQKVN